MIEALGYTFAVGVVTTKSKMSSEEQQEVVEPVRKKVVPKKTTKKPATKKVVPKPTAVQQDVMHDEDNNNNNVQEDGPTHDQPEADAMRDDDVAVPLPPVIIKKKKKQQPPIRVLNDAPTEKAATHDYTDLAPVVNTRDNKSYTTTPDYTDLDPKATLFRTETTISEPTDIFQDESLDGFQQQQQQQLDNNYRKSLEEYYEEENGGYESSSRSNSNVYICTDHQTLNGSPLTPASIVFAPDEDTAKDVLDNELVKRDLLPFKDYKYTLREVNMTIPKAYILSLLDSRDEDAKRQQQYKQFTPEISDQDYSDGESLSIFVCRNHWSDFPYPGISIVVAPNKDAATNILDQALIAAGGKPSTVAAYDLEPANHNREDIGVIVLSLGEVGVYRPR
jgi:hypothetical protein